MVVLEAAWLGGPARLVMLNILAQWTPNKQLWSRRSPKSRSFLPNKLANVKITIAIVDTMSSWDSGVDSRDKITLVASAVIYLPSFIYCSCELIATRNLLGRYNAISSSCRFVARNVAHTSLT